MKKFNVLLGATLILAVGLGCTQQKGERPEVAYQLPPLYDSLALVQYEVAGDSGYQQLEQGNVEGALAAFDRQIALVPDCAWAYYNKACAYSRTGQVEPGLQALEAALARGWGGGEHMRGDPDLDTLRKDPRFNALAARADSIMDANSAIFAKGLPTHAQPPAGLTTQKAIGDYYNAQRAILGRQQRVWTDWQYKTARLDLEARRITATKNLPEQERSEGFDEGIERVRAMTRFVSPYEPWGTIADGAIAEVSRYLESYPAGKFQDEAKYYGGLASFCRERPNAASSPNWEPSVSSASVYFKQVAPESEWAGPAEAWSIYFNLTDTLAGKQALQSRIKAFAEKYRENKQALRIAGMTFQGELVLALWPIQFAVTDIDGKQFSLADYKGQPLMIDFWATWCGPCRGELPFIKQAWEKYGKKGLQIVSISLDYADRTTPDAYRQWITENGMAWRHVYDQKDWSSDLARAFYVSSIPSPFLVDQYGNLAAFGEDLRQGRLDSTLAKLF